MALRKWRRLREAAAETAAPALLREDADLDQDGIGDDQDPEDLTYSVCAGCTGTGIKAGDICPTCHGAGTLMKESTNGSYWVYSDDPQWQQLREADHPQWAGMSEAPRTFSADVRTKYAASGVAMPDGSYPIPDTDALRRAIESYGHNPTAAVKAHIKKRARTLGQGDSLPDDWKTSQEADKSFGGKKAPPFGKNKGDSKDDKGDPKGDGKGKGDDNKPPWLKSKEADELAAGMMDRLDGLEQEMRVLGRLREAQPGRMTPTFSHPTRVQTSDGRVGYQVVLIREGKGNHEDDQWYTTDAIRELCESGVAEGMQAYGNHPTAGEEEDRPERDIKQMVGTYHDVKFVQESSKARAEAVFVPLTLDENNPHFGWVVTLAEAAARSNGPQSICGISLYGLSGGDDGRRPDGSFGRMVDIIRPHSGDIVTQAGAGGEFIRRVMESARALRNRSHKEPDPMKALEYQAKVREAVKRVREAGSDEERTTALDELSTLEAEKIDSVTDLTVEALREAAPKLVEQIGEQVKAGDSDTIDGLKAQLREAQGALGKVTEAIGVSTALREAGVTEKVEIRHFAHKAKELGLTDAGDIKEMVETEREYAQGQQDALLAKLKESIGGDDLEVEGAMARIPALASAQHTDGGVELMREAGLPVLEAATD